MAKFEIDTENRTIKILDTAISISDLNDIFKKYIPEPAGWELVFTLPEFNVPFIPNSPFPNIGTDRHYIWNPNDNDPLEPLFTTTSTDDTNN